MTLECAESNRRSSSILFLDTDVEENFPEDREITSFFYGEDERYRLKQEIVLRIGGARMLEALDLSIRKYHMNKGIPAFSHWSCCEDRSLRLICRFCSIS